MSFNLKDHPLFAMSFPGLPFGAMEMLSAQRSASLREVPRVQNSVVSRLENSNLVLRIHCQSVSLERIGGDVFETVRPDDSLLHVIIGDASGHGIGAGIMANEVMVHFHSLGLTARNPAEILTKLNDMIASWSRTERFMTAMVMTFDLKQHVMTYCSAGHPGFVRVGNQLQRLEVDHPPIGVIGDFPYENSGPIPLVQGSGLAIWTDGFNELTNEAGKMLGEESLLDWFASCASISPQQTTHLFFERATSFPGNAQHVDDMTLLIASVEAESNDGICPCLMARSSHERNSPPTTTIQSTEPDTLPPEVEL